MPVYEIKGPEPPLQPEPTGEQPLQVDGIRPVVRIRHYEGGHRKPEGGKGRRAGSLSGLAGKGLRRLVDRLNGELLRHNVPIHLVLMAAEEGLLLEVYDCTDQQVCRSIHDLEIRAAELPFLLGKLQKEAGLMVDVIS